ncbi:MAG: peptidoglycan-binding domain-containing protein [Paracoccaceae bacterium]
MRRTLTATTAMLAMTAALNFQPAFAASESELEFWRSAEKAGQTEDYRAYLDRYPDGDFASLARNRLLSTPSPSAATTPMTPSAEEAALGLTSSDKRRVQASLVAKGYDTRGVDGIFGGGTRSALRGWQQSQNRSASGYLTAADYATLTGATTGDVAAANARASDGSSPEEWREWREAERIGTPAAYRTYLDRYPNGEHSDEALTEIYGVTHYQNNPNTPATTTQDTARQIARAERREIRMEEEAELGYDALQRAEVERRLALAGFDSGAVDGDFNQSTRTAIASYRESRGLERGRFLDRNMVSRLVSETNGASFTSGPNAANTDGSIDPGVAAAVAAGALAVGGALLLDD